MDFREITQTRTNNAFLGANSAYIGNQKYVQRDRVVDSGNLLLDALPVGVRRQLQPSLKPVELGKEQFLYQEEDKLDFLYFPITAVVSEFKMLEDGRMVEIAVTGREGAVGLSSLFSDSRVSANCIQVSQAGTANRVDADTFAKLVRSNEEIRTELSHFIDVYIRQISQKAICNMYHSVKERLCTWLLMLQDRCGRRILNLTHEQIARTLGVYRPSITCIAQELRESKLINYSRGGILIQDRGRIEQSACTCYFELCY
jgi:CRP-like cAMP-binding protein